MSQKFMIGAATAAHQVEGNNTSSDLWVLENIPHSLYAEPSGAAVDHYHHYKEDIKMLKDAGANAYRFSIEWARIEPEEGVYDEKEVQHYVDMIDTCLALGIEPMVTLMHFSSPAWLTRKGGWEKDGTIESFQKYVSYLLPFIGDKLHYICTINEANMRIQIGTMIKGIMNRAKQGGTGDNPLKTLQVGMNQDAKDPMLSAVESAKAFGFSNPADLANFVSPGSEHGDMIVIRAHQAAKQVIHESYPNIKVGLTLSLHDMQAYPGGETFAAEEWDEEFLHYLPYIGEDDFIGIQNYTRKCFDATGNVTAKDATQFTQLGYEVYPQAVVNLVRKISTVFPGELIVTENGIATDDDELRCRFIKEAADGLHQCRIDGINLTGYFYWSLLDNYEWQQAYRPTFGLIAVDRGHDMKRTPKKSLNYLGSIQI